MHLKKEIVAMLLAGGQGSRLHVLTKELPKPAVPFGGKYRIIDFPLSNCSNSGIDTVGVLTQYQPLELNLYLGNGQPWDLDRMYGGVHVLPPHIKNNKGEWYKGTANAIYQNFNFMDQFNPEFVLILSGDHIYKMDYAKMLRYHKEKGADATIAVLDVSIEEASRFGIMNTNPDDTIYEFEEKPKNPKSTKASMGIYIFSWEKLKGYLVRDENNDQSTNDFGKDIIPSMLEGGEKLYAYPYEGYWKDVGTIESLWETNMDLLNPNIPLHLGDPLWRIYCRHAADMPQYIGQYANITDSMITEGCYVNGTVSNSVLSSGVSIGKDSVVDSSVVMQDTHIGHNAVIQYAIIAEGAIIEDGAIIGDTPDNYNSIDDWGIAVVGRNAIVKSGQIVLPNEMIEPDSGR